MCPKAVRGCEDKKLNINISISYMDFEIVKTTSLGGSLPISQLSGQKNSLGYVFLTKANHTVIVHFSFGLHVQLKEGWAPSG